MLDRYAGKLELVMYLLGNKCDVVEGSSVNVIIWPTWPECYIELNA
jgi:hypothetical protein